MGKHIRAPAKAKMVVVKGGVTAATSEKPVKVNPSHVNVARVGPSNHLAMAKGSKPHGA